MLNANVLPLIWLFGMATFAHADNIAGLTWTGDPTIYQSSPSCGSGGVIGAVGATTGIDALGTCVPGDLREGSGSFTINRTFTVTSPGDFIVSTTVAFSADSFSCSINLLDCGPDASVSGMADSEVFLVNTDTNTSGPFGGGAFASASNITACNGTPSCETFASDNRSGTSVVELATGNYNLMLEGDFDLRGIEASMKLTVDTSVTPTTPEPRGYAAVVGILFFVIVYWHRRAVGRRSEHSRNQSSA